MYEEELIAIMNFIFVKQLEKRTLEHMLGET